MPVGACDGCGRYYVLDADETADVGCPRCGQPLRSSDKSELLSHLRDPAAHSDASGPPDARCAAHECERLLSDRLLQRAQDMRTQIRSHRDEVSAQVVEARRLANQMKQLLKDLRTTIAPQDTSHPH